MSARPYHHTDGTGRKRCARTSAPMSPGELSLWLAEQVGDGYEPQVSVGVFVEWYSPLTEDEAATEAAHKARADARQEQWERDTYERLRAKFEGAVAVNRAVSDDADA